MLEWKIEGFFQFIMSKQGVYHEWSILLLKKKKEKKEALIGMLSGCNPVTGGTFFSSSSISIIIPFTQHQRYFNIYIALSLSLCIYIVCFYFILFFLKREFISDRINFFCMQQWFIHFILKNIIFCFDLDLL